MAGLSAETVRRDRNCFVFSKLPVAIASAQNNERLLNN
jgi:hypothetical protein